MLQDLFVRSPFYFYFYYYFFLLENAACSGQQTLPNAKYEQIPARIGISHNTEEGDEKRPKGPELWALQIAFHLKLSSFKVLQVGQPERCCSNGCFQKPFSFF